MLVITHRKFLACVGMILAGLLPMTDAVAVDFKGVELGQPLWRSVERSVFGELDCTGHSSDPDYYDALMNDVKATFPSAQRVCVAETSIAKVPADATVVLGASRTVLKMTFEFRGEAYDSIVTAMASKWGDGISEVRDEFDQSVWWDFEDGATVSVHQVPAYVAGSDKKFALGLAEYSLPAVAPAGDL